MKTNVPSFPIEIAEAIGAGTIHVPGTIFNTARHSPEWDQTMVEVRRFFDTLAGFLRGHEHFYLEHPENFIGLDYRGLDLSEARPPFPVTGLMYRYDQVLFGAEPTMLPDRVPLDRDRFVLLLDLPDVKAFRICSFYRSGDVTGSPWTLSPVGAQIMRDHLADASETINDKTARYMMVSPIPGIVEEDIFAEAKNAGLERGDLADMIADDIRLAVGFLAISSAKNVPVERLPAPVKLNKKRAKRGKPPLPGYHVLDLGFGRKVEHTGGESGRTHASPRLHTRRGHMRQCASGTITYVRPTLVGDPTKGVVSKDYRARVKK